MLCIIVNSPTIVSATVMKVIMVCYDNTIKGVSQLFHRTLSSSAMFT